MSTPLSFQNNTSGCFQQCFAVREDENSKPAASIPLSHLLHHHREHDTRQEMKPSEDFLASELSKLSVQERSEALDDLHCVGEDLEDTPELIQTSLLELDRILTEKNAAIYSIAASQNRAYVEDPNFRLRFLRANDHDAEKAANQVIGFLTQKKIYFGVDKIARDITLDDLDEKDMNVLLSGRFHIQDGLDQKGRVVVYVLNHHAFHLSDESLMRANYIVFFNILSAMSSVQKKGVVVCYYDLSQPEAPVTLPNMNMIRRFMAFQTKVPVRRTGFHFCLKPTSVSLFSNTSILEYLLRAFPQSVRVRARVHSGSDVELQYKLGSHGLPMGNIPVDANGNIRNHILNVWFHSYVAKERDPQLESSSASPTAILSADGKNMDDGNDHAVENWSSLKEHHGWNESTSAESATLDNRLVEPTPKDVLLGPGRGLMKHPGNVSFREFLKDYQEEYDNTPRYKRVQTHKELTRLLLDDGVRFLRKTESGDGWVEIDFSEAEKKVKQLFRSRKKNSKKAVS